MAFQLVARNLASRAIRSSTTGGAIRQISVGAVSRESDGEGGFLSTILDSGVRFIGSVFSDTWALLTNILSIDFSSLWSGIVGAVRFLWNFNWRVTDEELNNTITNAFNGLGSHLGQFAGSAFGWLACGAVPGVMMFSFNEALALHVLKNVGEEAFDELITQATSVMYSVFNGTVTAGFAWAYKNGRNLLLREDGLLDRVVSAGIIPAETAQQLRESAEDDEPWSFALEMEERIESIDSVFWRNFAEGFAEGASESCVEAGYVVANSIDSFIAQQRIANDSVLGDEVLVEIAIPGG